MTSPAANKRRGSQWEIALVKGFREDGLEAERLHLNGKNDEGDIVVFAGSPNRQLSGRVIVEAKSGAMNAAEFVRQATLERDNYCKHRGLDPETVEAVAVVKARGKNWKDAYVLSTVREYFGLE